MAVLGNTVDCSATQKGTGLAECIQELGKPVGFIELGDWTASRLTETIDLAYFNTKVLEQQFVPFVNAVDFVDNTEDDVFQTFTSGQKRVVRNGLNEFDFIYTNGYHWNAAAYSHNTNQNGAIAFIWENGVIGFQLNSDNVTLSGLKRGYLKTKSFQNNDGANVSQTMISFQLLDPDAYNTKMYLYNEDSAGFSFDSIKGAIASNLDVDTVPAVAATDFSVDIYVAGNRSIKVPGLVVANVQMTGQTISTVAYNASTQLYDITTDAMTAGVKTLTLGDGALELGVDLSGTLYSGSGSFTVV